MTLGWRKREGISRMREGIRVMGEGRGKGIKVKRNMGDGRSGMRKEAYNVRVTTNKLYLHFLPFTELFVDKISRH